jgi:hypothetical protein
MQGIELPAVSPVAVGVMVVAYKKYRHKYRHIRFVALIK